MTTEHTADEKIAALLVDVMRRWRPGVVSTHYEFCYRVHAGCLAHRIRALTEEQEMMSEHLKPGIYRGQSAGCFGLWRLTPRGEWLYSIPVCGYQWRRTSLPLDELDGLVPIALDTDTGPLA